MPNSKGSASSHHHQSRGSGSERGFFTTPRLMVVALHQGSAFCAATLAPGRSNSCAGGHSFRSRAMITMSWKASPLRANSRGSPSCTIPSLDSTWADAVLLARWGAELYNPATGTFMATGSLAMARYLHTATVLNSGKVLIAGSQISTGGQLASVEL